MIVANLVLPTSLAIYQLKRALILVGVYYNSSVPPQICSALIDSLIKCYLDDIASTDAISERLRDVCPNLFSSDDAVSTKVMPSLQQ